MSEEIQEAVQILRVAYDGIEIAMKVGSGGLSVMKKALELVTKMVEYEKMSGKTSMRNLLLKGGDLQVFQFSEDKLKMVEKYAKKYGISYSLLPKLDKNANGVREIVFHSEALPRVNMLKEKLSTGGLLEKMKKEAEKKKESSIMSLQDFMVSDPKKVDDLIGFLKKETKVSKDLTPEDIIVQKNVENLLEKVGMYAVEQKQISVEGVKEKFSIDHDQATKVLGQLQTMGLIEASDQYGIHRVVMDKEGFQARIRGYQDLAERMRAIAKSKDINLADVTISKTLIAKESETAIKTRVPGTFGDNARFVWIPKENIMEIHNGKTLLTFLDKNKEYKLYDSENRVAETKKGQDLYKNHYDQVEATVRDYYEKLQKEEVKKVAVESAKKISEEAAKGAVVSTSNVAKPVARR